MIGGAAKNLEQKIKYFQPDFIYERANYLQLSGIKMANKDNIQHVLEMNAPLLEDEIAVDDLFIQLVNNYIIINRKIIYIIASPLDMKAYKESN